MRKFLSGRILSALVVAALFFSCGNKKENTPSGPYSTGIVVLNEGVFLKNNAELSFISEDLSKSESNVFSKENGKKVGDVLQSYALEGDNLHLVVNMSNKIETVSRGTLKQKSSIGEFSNPRYMVLNGKNKAYVSNWGNPFGTPRTAPFLAVVDLASNKISKKLYVGDGAENLLLHKNRLYVSASFSDKIYVYDMDRDVLVDSLSTAPHSPYAMFADENEKIWVMTFSYDANFNATEGAIQRFDTKTAKKEATLKINSGGANIRSRLVYDKSQKRFFYLTSAGVFASPVSASTLPSTPFIPGNFSALGIRSDGKIFLGVSDFVNESNNRIRVYDDKGQFLKEFETGFAPNGFVF